MQDPPNMTGPAMALYEVTDTLGLLFPRSLANPKHGKGRLPQVFIPDFDKHVRMVDVIPFSKP